MRRRIIAAASTILLTQIHQRRAAKKVFALARVRGRVSPKARREVGKVFKVAREEYKMSCVSRKCCAHESNSAGEIRSVVRAHESNGRSKMGNNLPEGQLPDTTIDGKTSPMPLVMAMEMENGEGCRRQLGLKIEHV